MVVVTAGRLARFSRESNGQSSRRGNCLNGLGENVVVDYHEQNIDTLGSDTEYVVFNNLGFQAYGNRRKRSSSPFKDYADRDFGSSYSAHAWSLVKLCEVSGRTNLGVKLGQPRRLFRLHVVVEHPSEAKMRNKLCFCCNLAYSHLL